MSETAFERLITLIQETTGLTVDENRQRDVQRVVQGILAAEQLPDVRALIDRLERQPLHTALWRDLINTVTVSETYFFRNQAHFDALRHHLLPDLIAQKRAAGTLVLRLWSAGCATGEEPYSLAILLEELLPDRAAW